MFDDSRCLYKSWILHGMDTKFIGRVNAPTAFKLQQLKSFYDHMIYMNLKKAVFFLIYSLLQHNFAFVCIWLEENKGKIFNFFFCQHILWLFIKAQIPGWIFLCKN